MLKGEEMSWTVRVMKVKPHFVKILSGFMSASPGTHTLVTSPAPPRLCAPPC
jgi:hypothetical protein